MNLNKEAFIGGIISKGASKVGGMLFGSAEHSLKSNIAKSVGLTGLTNGIPGAGTITKIPNNKISQGQGFKMNRLGKLTKESGLGAIKAPSIKGLSGLTTKVTTPKSVVGSVSPASSVSPKSILAKSAEKHDASFKGLKTIGLMSAGAAAIKGVDKLSKKYDEYSDKKKFSGIISHAKKENPELRRVPTKKLHSWMNTFYSLAPHIAKDEGLATSMLTTVHNYGGDVDLATAKMISEIGHKSKHDKGSVSDGLKNSMSLLMD